MKIGTKSLLFGAHQVLLHPIFLFIAWWRLYGFPWDPRLWVAFVVHDWGYWGKPNMDGPEGETHPLLGARIMGALFDPPTWRAHGLRVAHWFDEHFHRATRSEADLEAWLTRWHDFALYHSRFYSKAAGKPFSRLCVADKLAIAITPWWLYLPSVWLTGELAEYMALADKRNLAGEHSLNPGKRMAGATPREWHRRMTAHCRAWAFEHRDCRPDTWTPVMPKP